MYRAFTGILGLSFKEFEFSGTACLRRICKGGIHPSRSSWCGPILLQKEKYR